MCRGCCCLRNLILQSMDSAHQVGWLVGWLVGCLVVVLVVLVILVVIVVGESAGCCVANVNNWSWSSCWWGWTLKGHCSSKSKWTSLLETLLLKEQHHLGC
jgi:hypothetical protein